MASPIRTVVAATDFSFSAHRAARRAAALAKMHGAALHLLHVLDSSSAKALLRRSPAIDVERPLHLEAERALNSLAEDVAGRGPSDFDAIDSGPPKNARLLEPLASFNIQLGYGLGMGTQIGFKLLHGRRGGAS